MTPEERAQLARWKREVLSVREAIEERDAVPTDRALVLPDSQGGCTCIPFDQDAGEGYVEHLLEYDPACPEHSTHVYDPRTGTWIGRDKPVESTEDMVEWAAQVIRRIYGERADNSSVVARFALPLAPRKEEP